MTPLPPPELFSPLLTPTPAERLLTHQATAVQHFQRLASGSELRLMCLGRELASSLFTAPGMEALLAAPFSDALEQVLRQQSEPPLASPAEAIFASKASMALHAPPAATPARKVLMPEPFSPLGTQHPQANPHLTTFSRTKTQPLPDKYPVTRQALASPPQKPDLSAVTLGRKPFGKTPQQNKNRSQTTRPFPTKLDAEAAQRQLTMRASRIGATAAWNIPINPPASPNPSRVEQKPQKEPHTLASIAAAERQLAACLGGLASRRGIPSRQQPPEQFKNNDWGIPESPTSGRFEKPLVHQSARQTARQTASSSPAHSPNDAYVKPAGGIYGLRGLAAQAVGPIDPESPSRQGSAVTAPAQTRFDNMVTSALGSHSTLATELAKVLNEEARRAGIDLDEVGS
ncbi:hypothetical protein SAMN05660964_01434 [Thiothrix caldifontis]|uniref:Uncharacterized protein n=1 Tax=Thiothrix caldifontis TaxID=525918 RepID=A0A1H4ANC6_9GAMM|nr:hypothetical protein [Thiothrix caldifontis]SEA37410.1 hypothetical protein SAMN05660964_01434 [Thiothrix caldifontis]